MILVALVSAAFQRPPTLQYYQQTFVLRQGSQEVQVPIKPQKPAPRLSIEYRQNQTFLVWDDRGLTIRVGKKSTSTHLENLAVSPRLFPHATIRANLKLFESGKKSKAASALAGSRRIGRIVYLLPRWSTPGGAPWLEALIAVDLGEKRPKPVLLGKFQGCSLAENPIDDRLLVVRGTDLGAITRDGDSWGLATYDPKAAAFKFHKAGSNLIATAGLGDRAAAFLEKSAYGTTILGQLNLSTGEPTNLNEHRGRIRLLDNDQPILEIVRNGDQAILENVQTGAQTTLPNDCGESRTRFGLLVWSPAADPKSATLYTLARFEKLTAWPTNPK